MENIDFETIPKEIDSIMLNEEDRKRLAHGLETGVVENEKGRRGQFRALQTEEGLKFHFSEVYNKQRIPKILGGVRLTKEQRKKIKIGEPIMVKNMMTKKGAMSGVVYYDAKTRKTIIRPATGIRTREPKELCGVLLSPEQRESLKAGNPTKINGLQTRSGNYNGVISLDDEKGVVFHKWEKQSRLERAFKLVSELAKSFKETKRQEKVQEPETKGKEAEGMKFLGKNETAIPAIRPKGDLTAGVTIELDKEENHFVPETIAGVKLTEEQKESLENGEQTMVNGVRTEQGYFNVVLSFDKEKGLTLHEHQKLAMIKQQGRIDKLDEILAAADKEIEALRGSLGIDKAPNTKTDTTTPNLPPASQLKKLPSVPRRGGGISI